MAKGDKPTVLVRKQGRALVPVSAFDDEEVSAFPQGQVFDLKPRASRSPPLLRTYWKMLAEVRAGTALEEYFPTKEHLHEWLVQELGYVKALVGPGGKVFQHRESISFRAMRTDAEFRPYFDAAVKRLAEVTGTDPLGFMEVA
jgi:hypothetical protein